MGRQLTCDVHMKNGWVVDSVQFKPQDTVK